MKIQDAIDINCRVEKCKQFLEKHSDEIYTLSELKEKGLPVFRNVKDMYEYFDKQYIKANNRVYFGCKKAIEEYKKLAGIK